jgi:DNA-binding NtrC family response regulator
MGPRAGGPFVVIDCAATPRDALEIELFGCESGGAGGALETAGRRGAFEQADKGTLLIDEIGALDVALQAKLLRTLERGELTRVGGDTKISVDVRVLVATRLDLDRETQEGRFREDLAECLGVARIELPPLRRRKGDVAFLARHFWQELAQDEAQLPSALLTRWADYAWPGNVRELKKSVLQKLAVGDLADTGVAPDEELHAVSGGIRILVDRAIAEDVTLTRARQGLTTLFDRIYIERILKKHNGSVIRAASAAGVARRYFQILKARPK